MMVTALLYHMQHLWKASSLWKIGTPSILELLRFMTSLLYRPQHPGIQQTLLRRPRIWSSAAASRPWLYGSRSVPSAGNKFHKHGQEVLAVDSREGFAHLTASAWVWCPALRPGSTIIQPQFWTSHAISESHSLHLKIGAGYLISEIALRFFYLHQPHSQSELRQIT